MRGTVKFILLSFLLILVLPPPTFVNAGWLSGWSYRIPITVDNTGNSNTLTDYQVKIVIDTATLISQGKMRSDCGDIRFTDSDGTTLLNYWIESGINTASTVIWVKIPSIPASSTKTIYIYFGNPSATSQSNGDATFEFFDDFTSSTLDTSKWTTAGTGSYTISGGLLTVYDPYYITSIVSFGTGFALRTRVKVGPADTSGVCIVMLSAYGGTTDNAENRTSPWIYSTSYSNFMASSGNGSTYEVIQYPVPRDTDFHVAEARRLPTADYFQLDDTSELVGNYPTTTSRYVKIYVYSADIVVDYVLVRKYSRPEPTVSLGSIETPNNPPSVSITSVSPLSIYRGNWVTIQGSASDSDGNVTAVYLNITAPGGSLVITNGLANGTVSWSYNFGTSASATLGYYSVCAVAQDDQGGKSTPYCLDNVFQVLNNPPEITANGTYGVPSPGSQVTFWVNATDFEDSTLTAKITITAPNSSIVVNQAIMSYRNDHYEYDFTPDVAGDWEVEIVVYDSDGDSDSVSWTLHVTSAPVVEALSVDPRNTTRPGVIDIEALISDPDTPISDIIASFKVYSPSGALYVQGSLALAESNGDLGYFRANFTISLDAEVGLYDIEIFASDENETTVRNFANALEVINIAPTVSSVTLNATVLERGKTVAITVEASDPETPRSQLIVRVKVDDPDGLNVMDSIASWNPSMGKHESSFTPTYNAKLGRYTIEVTATDTDGVTGGPAIANLTVVNAKPVIKNVTAYPNYVTVNSSVLIRVDAEDFETLKSNLRVRVKVGKDILNATLREGLFECVYNPTSVGKYGVQVNVTDEDGGLTTMSVEDLFEAVPSTTEVPPTTTTTTTPLIAEIGVGNLTNWINNLFANLPSLSELGDLLYSAQSFIWILVGAATLLTIKRSREERRRAPSGRRR